MGLRDHPLYVYLAWCEVGCLTLPSTATYSNIDNHPRLIRARQSKVVPKIQLDPRTGLPTVDGQPYPLRPSKDKQISTIEEEEEEGDHKRKSFSHHTFALE